MKLNFSNYSAAQDMIKIIERDKGLSAVDAIIFCISENTYKRIIETGWADIALNLWGHDNPKREWSKMDNPYLDVEIEESKLKLVNDIVIVEEIDIEMAVCYFLIFTMEQMGYHI